jgi:hypothetical protein
VGLFSKFTWTLTFENWFFIRLQNEVRQLQEKAAASRDVDRDLAAPPREKLEEALAAKESALKAHFLKSTLCSAFIQ